jgi:hypothetical protein
MFIIGIHSGCWECTVIEKNGGVPWYYTYHGDNTLTVLLSTVEILSLATKSVDFFFTEHSFLLEMKLILVIFSPR